MILLQEREKEQGHLGNFSSFLDEYLDPFLEYKNINGVSKMCFLLVVLEKMGFGPNWLRCRWCISSTCFFVLLNKTHIVFFASFRGLRQRDPFPLSILFILFYFLIFWQ